MKQVYIASDMIDAELFKDYLLSLRISAVVKGAILSGIIGEIPTNTYPTVWIDDERDYTLARKAVVNYEQKNKENASADKWICVQCGETIEPQFSQCWSCGKNRLE